MEPNVLEIIRTMYPHAQFKTLEPKERYNSCIIGVLALRNGEAPRLAYGARELKKAAAGDPDIGSEYRAKEHVDYVLRSQHRGPRAPIIVDEDPGLADTSFGAGIDRGF